MSLGSLVLAFTAGMVSTFNPCGFSLLPGYIGAFVLGDDPDAQPEGRIRRALTVATAISAGFVLLFATTGLVIDSVATEIRRQLPWVTIGVGLILVAAGVAMTAGWKPTWSVRIPRWTRGQGGRRVMVTYGIVYAVASLSCTLGPFLAVTGTAMTQSVAGGLAAYVAFGLGMSVVVFAISIATAVGHGALADRMRRVSANATRLGGIILVLAGLYVAWYGRWELRVLAGGSGEDAAVQAIESVRTFFVSQFEAVGSGIGLVLVVTIGGLWLLSRRRRSRGLDLADDHSDPVRDGGR